MGFIWPSLLLFLLAIPIGVWVYRSRERRRAQKAASFGLGSPGSPTPRRWVRRIPAACTVLGMTILIMSLARPETVVGVPRLEGTVVLAFDVSGSMAATDVAPTRLEAAKAAALELVARQPASIRIGVVVFSDAGFATQVPTGDRADIEAAIRRLEPERGTTIARGIEEALTVVQTALDPSTTAYYTNDSAPDAPDPTPMPVGVYEPAIIVLLTDGENTGGVDPLEMAQTARERGIRIDTVGFGTEAGTPLEVEGFRIQTRLESGVLKAIADRTNGTYYAAAEDDLSAIYDDVGSRFIVRAEPQEVTALFAAVGFVLLLIGAGLSLRWFGRAP